MPTLVEWIRERWSTVALSAAGTGVLLLLDLPLPFLFGPMGACLIAALAGWKLKGVGRISIGARAILGIAIGAAVTPEVIARVPTMALSVSLIPVYILVIALIGVPFFRRVYGFDMVTSWYAAMPGGLQDMVIFGTEAGGDPRALSLIHATRVLVIVTVAPLILTGAFGVSLNQPIGSPARDLPIFELALMVIVGFVGWKGGERIGLFGASILGPLILTAALSLFDVIHNRPPKEAILAAQFLIGMGIGIGYVGVTLHELRRDILAGVFFVLILAVLAFGFTEVVVLFGLANPVEGFLAFAPGGQAEMTILAIVAGADLGFIIVHHLSRVFIVILGAPVAARLVRAGPGRNQTEVKDDSRRGGG